MPIADIAWNVVGYGSSIRPWPNTSSGQARALLSGAVMPEDVVPQDGAMVRATIASRLADAQRRTAHLSEEPSSDCMKVTWPKETEEPAGAAV